jgi:hypothetical protein
MWRLIPAVACFSVFLVGGCWVHSIQLDKELESLNGWLIPANDPDSDRCKSDKYGDSAFNFYFGGLTVVAKGQTLRIINLHRDPPESDVEALRIDREPDGTVALTAHVFGEDNKEIVQIDRNHFFINRNRILDSLSPPRPDRSTILIRDESGNELKIRLMNKHSISFEGKLYVQPGRYLQMDRSGARLEPGNSTIDGNGCMYFPNSDRVVFLEVR